MELVINTFGTSLNRDNESVGCPKSFLTVNLCEMEFRQSPYTITAEQADIFGEKKCYFCSKICNKN